MSSTLVERRTAGSQAATYAVVLLLSLCFRPSILYPLAEVAYAGIFFIVTVYLVLGKHIFWSYRKTLFVSLATLFYVFIVVQGIAFGTAPLAVVAREMGFMIGVVFALVLINRHTWRAALVGFITPVLVLLPSYLFSGIFTLLTGTYEGLVLHSFVLDMGDDTYEAIWAFPYSLYLGGVNEVGPIDFNRATGSMREPGIYQILITIAYFGVDFLQFRYKRLLKGALLANLFLTFSTAGWGAFAASWVYYNVFSSRRQGMSVLRALGQRVWALILSVPLVYYVFFAEAKASVSQKLAGASGQVRLLQSAQALQEFWSSPLLGVGWGNPSVPGIHFMGVLAEVGLVGVAIIALLTFGPVWTFIRRWHPILVFLIPLVLTMLFSQPIFGKTIYFLVLALVISFPRSELPDTRP